MKELIRRFLLSNILAIRYFDLIILLLQLVVNYETWRIFHGFFLFGKITKVYYREIYKKKTRLFERIYSREISELLSIIGLVVFFSRFFLRLLEILFQITSNLNYWRCSCWKKSTVFISKWRIFLSLKWSVKNVLRVGKWLKMYYVGRWNEAFPETKLTSD